MKFESQVHYLVLQRPESSKQQVLTLAVNLESVLEQWQPYTRVSPVFVVQNPYSRTDAIKNLFNGKKQIVFLGPIHPERIPISQDEEATIWLTLGLFNVVIITPSTKYRKLLTKWAQENAIGCEYWVTDDGKVKSAELFTHELIHDAWKNSLIKLSKKKITSDLKLTINDYTPLMASTLSRSFRLPYKMFEELTQINEYVVSVIENYAQESDSSKLYPTLSQLLSINASLTRFASQTFSGSIHILDTDCHLKLHSLLGIGTANLALAHLRQFIQKSLGSARIPEKFALLSQKAAPANGLTLLQNKDELWFQDNLEDIMFNEKEADPLVPLVSYFSARDGFKSNLTNISVPLTSISACNSVQWSLLTMTHELSHIIIRSVFTKLIPRYNTEEGAEFMLQLLKKDYQPLNLLEDIQRLFLYTVIKIDQVATHPPQTETKVNGEILKNILEHWHREVEELLVHIFDFLYFYGGEIDKYIAGIWITWGTIPNINSRLKEYVVRTICTALVHHLRRGNLTEDLAKEQVVNAFKELKNKVNDSSYIDNALAYLDTHWDDEIREMVLARKPLVKIARAFLFSQSIATKVRGESTGLEGETKSHEGYALRSKYIELDEIDNPFRFLEFYTKSHQPSIVDSTWMLYVLAFCVKE